MSAAYLQHSSSLLYMQIEAIQVKWLFTDGGHVIQGGAPLLQKAQQTVQEVTPLRLTAHFKQFVHIATLLQWKRNPIFEKK